MLNQQLRSDMWKRRVTAYYLPLCRYLLGFMFPISRLLRHMVLEKVSGPFLLTTVHKCEKSSN